MALPANLTYLTAKELHQAWWIAIRKRDATETHEQGVYELTRVRSEFRRRGIPYPRRKPRS